MSLTRRHALRLGLGTCVGFSVSTKGCSTTQGKQVQEMSIPVQMTTVDPKISLKQRAATKGLYFGAAGSHPALSSDAKYAAMFAQECNILVTENEMKWSFLRPTPDSFDFSKADWLATFARTHKMLLRGHTLVWDQQLPGWFKETVNRQNAEQTMVKHIQTVAKHYAGQVHSWDVVNEAVAVPHTNRSDGLHPSPWLEFLGKDYIELAFRVAAEADPKTLLVYNDRWLDYDTSRDNAQRTAVLKLLEHLKAKNTPLHALGIQAHLEPGKGPFDPKKLRSFLKEVADLGLKILITELDVADAYLPTDLNTRDQMVASAYQEYLSTVLDEPAVMAVLTWGLSDRYSWLAKYAPRKDGAPVRPLPFDTEMKQKPAWHAIAHTLDQTSKRPSST